jgi:hypothetical protein
MVVEAAAVPEMVILELAARVREAVASAQEAREPSSTMGFIWRPTN